MIKEQAKFKDRRIKIIAKVLWEGMSKPVEYWVVTQKMPIIDGVVQVFEQESLGKQLLEQSINGGTIIEWHKYTNEFEIAMETKGPETEESYESQIRIYSFTIYKNGFLKNETRGYYCLDYVGIEDPSTDFIRGFKNTYNNVYIGNLNAYKMEAKTYLLSVLPEIMTKESMDSCVLVSVPRAKKQESYYDTQLYLQRSISEAAEELREAGFLIANGAKGIIRQVNTKTTHFVNKPDTERIVKGGTYEANDGERPYVGITEATCSFDRDLISGQNVILVDDIYTARVNIDEDCIQALYNNGAKNVVFFAFAKTKRWCE